MRQTIVLASICLIQVALGSGGFLSAAEIVGHWLEHAPHARIRMDEHVSGEFGGWQTSDLTFDVRTKTWWSIGDQNCRELQQFYPNGVEPHRGRYLYRFSQISPTPQAEPVPIMWDQKAEFKAVSDSFNGVGTGFIDFEGIAADPTRANYFFACTEGPKPWLVEIEYRATKNVAAVIRTVRISTQGNHDRNKSGEAVPLDPNRVWEGIAVSPDGQMIYLATEWSDSAARIYRVPMSQFREGNVVITNGEWKSPKVHPEAFITNGLQGDLTGLCFVTRKDQLTQQDKLLLIALERNSPALYFIDMASPHSEPRRHNLDLRAPALDVNNRRGIKINSASPEGIATDGTGKLFLIGDPVRNLSDGKRLYFAPNGGADTNKLENLIPLVFEVRIDDL